MRIFQLSYHPVIKRSVIFKFQSTDRVCYSLNGILDRMSKVIHGINAPLVSRIMVGHMGHTVNNRISHIDIRRSHIDLGSEHMAAVREFPVFHFFKQFQILFYTSVPVGTFLSRLSKSSSVFPDLFRTEIADKSLAFLDQLYGCLIHLIKVI